MVSVYTRSPLGSCMVETDIEGGGGTMSLNGVPFIIQKILSVSEWLHLYSNVLYAPNKGTTTTGGEGTSMKSEKRNQKYNQVMTSMFIHLYTVTTAHIASFVRLISSKPGTNFCKAHWN